MIGVGLLVLGVIAFLLYLNGSLNGLLGGNEKTYVVDGKTMNQEEYIKYLEAPKTGNNDQGGVNATQIALDAVAAYQASLLPAPAANASVGEKTGTPASEKDADAKTRAELQKRIVNRFEQFLPQRNDYWNRNGFPKFVQIKDEDERIDPRVFERVGYDSDEKIIGNDQGIEDYHTSV
ncbi:MAG: hypothetical protein WC450_10815, partial [Candidatus Omnitrophota bacterium]